MKLTEFEAMIGERRLSDNVDIKQVIMSAQDANELCADVQSGFVLMGVSRKTETKQSGLMGHTLVAEIQGVEILVKSIEIWA